MGHQQRQGAGTWLFCQVLRCIRSGKTKALSEAVIDKTQQYTHPKTVKKLQTYVGFLGYGKIFSPHLATLMKPLH